MSPTTHLYQIMDASSRHESGTPTTCDRGCRGLGILLSTVWSQVALRMLVGSVLDARSAGGRQASVATAESVATAAAIVVTSYGVTPKMSDRRTGTLLSASTTPAISPAVA